MAFAKNSLEGKAEPFLTRIENLADDILSERGTYMAKAKAIREDIKVVYGEAKDAGLPTKSLRALVKHRELERKKNALADGLDNDDAKIYEHLAEVLGDLGAAAARRAGHAPAGTEDEKDLRPRHLRQPDAGSDTAH